MYSQGDVTDLLRKLPTIPAEEVKNEIGSMLPILISSLETNTSRTVALQSACALFQQCLPCFQDIDDAVAHIFSPGLPAIKQLLNESLQGIHTQFQNPQSSSDLLDILASLLQVCISLLESVDCCLSFVKNHQEIQSLRVKVVLVNVGDILLAALQHCNDSQQIYGTCLDNLTDILGGFFRLTNDLLAKFIEIIRDIISFNCNFEDQQELLCDVLKFLMVFGQLSSCLGVRAMSETWKIYANLTTKYSRQLQSSLSLAEPLAHLSSELTRIAQAVIDKSGEPKTVERNLKVASFLLRIIIKLCELYPADLEDCLTTLSSLLIQLNSYSELSLTVQGRTCIHHHLLDRHLVVGAEPLLNQLVSSRHFSKKVLSTPDTNTDEEPVPYVLLLLAVANQIQSQPAENRKPWFHSAAHRKNICSALFSAINKCSNAFNCDIMNSTYTESFGSMLYNTILQSIIALAYSLNDSERSVLEQSLFFSINSCVNTPWLYLVICDIWVMMIRIAGPALCLKHIQFLKNIVKHENSGQIRTVYISLVQRLLNVMPVKQRPPSDGIKELEAEIKWSPNNTLKVKEIINNFIYDQTNYSYLELCRILNLISISDPSSLKPIHSELFQLWKTVDFSHYYDSRIAKKLLIIINSIAPEMSNEQLLLTLKKLVKLPTPDLKIETIHFLTSLSKLCFTKDKFQSAVCDHIASVYSLLLQDSNVLIKRFTLDSFVAFAHCTSHEDILPKTVSGSQSLQQMITTYIQCKPSIDKLLLSRQIVVASFDCVTSNEWENLKFYHSSDSQAGSSPIKANSNEMDSECNKQVENKNGEAKILNDKEDLEDMDTENPFEIPSDPAYDSERKKDFTSCELEDRNYLDESIQELIVQVNYNADTLLDFHKQSLVSHESILKIQEVVKKLQQMIPSDDGKLNSI